jgi:hypothetical protein
MGSVTGCCTGICITSAPCPRSTAPSGGRLSIPSRSAAIRLRLCPLCGTVGTIWSRPAICRGPSCRFDLMTSILGLDRPRALGPLDGCFRTRYGTFQVRRGPHPGLAPHHRRVLIRSVSRSRGRAAVTVDEIREVAVEVDVASSASADRERARPG